VIRNKGTQHKNSRLGEFSKGKNGRKSYAFAVYVLEAKIQLY
jgi:hypothetical protein